ncbi:hypothetical protein AKJ44_02495 [candidate division MSBL1 archaeon SCGC-AAA261F17]|uniref:Plasmid pRiA4b Orf3-like domain-containing protein n=1 Tax=candidate division MSBL1 archaeon SCGC-AAA261F17 TaxID=1698274 RepID=A0A133V4T6_9EURY|nr:hypothetical protein AKJ44_02495 [candidate division MSBL1 archaeon SCGC-AAA261F17]
MSLERGGGKIQAKTLQLKIILDGVKPPIWRRFLVKNSMTFRDLHKIIQIVMGWEDYHLYEFSVNDLRIEDAERFSVDSMWKAFRPKAETESAKRTRLSELLKTEKQKFSYLYDFGDSWRHTVVVEKILDDGERETPACLAGERACPPEDCGGVWGYEELLKIKEDKNHPLYQERIVEWLGEGFDPESFDLDGVNEALSSLERE